MPSEARYNAACSAALAAAGKGKDDPSPDDATRVVLRRQALGWLRSDLAAWVKIQKDGPPTKRGAVGPTLRHWKRDTDLAALRDEAELAKLPEADARCVPQTVDRGRPAPQRDAEPGESEPVTTAPRLVKARS